MVYSGGVTRQYFARIPSTVANASTSWFGLWHSADGGESWHLLQNVSEAELTTFEIGGNGALLAFGSNNKSFSQLSVSFNMGDSSSACEFDTLASLALENVIVPSFAAQQFLVLGRNGFARLRPRQNLPNCTADDWGVGRQACELGKSVVTRSFLPHAPCIPQESAKIVEGACPCTKKSFEVSFSRRKKCAKA